MWWYNQGGSPLKGWLTLQSIEVLDKQKGAKAANNNLHLAKKAGSLYYCSGVFYGVSHPAKIEAVCK
jgi:hypothetical protein